jgi:hypothetical protein
VGVDNAMPRGRLVAVRGRDGRVCGHHEFITFSSGYGLLKRTAPGSEPAVETSLGLTIYGAEGSPLTLDRARQTEC